MGERAGICISKTAVGGVTALISAAGLAALKSGDLTGVSQLLAVAYSLVGVAIVCRHMLHTYEGYYGHGLGGPMVFELATLIATAAIGWVILGAENPQIPRLAACSGFVAVLLFFCATKMEDGREKLMREGIHLRRASDVLRQSRVWIGACNRFGRIQFGFVKRLREFFAGRDTKAGDLSVACATALVAFVAIGLAAMAMAGGSMLVQMPITPTEHDKGTTRADDPSPGLRQKQVPEPKKGGPYENPEPASADCGEDYDPGPLPEPERTSLLLGWQGMPGITPGPMEALGFEIAGCPQPPRPIPGNPGSWFATGYCEGELQAIVIAPRGVAHPVVLLEQAAEFVQPLIEDGDFVRAVDRFSVGGGDAYVIDSTVGSYVLIRDRTTAGPVDSAEQTPGKCGEYTDEDVLYTIVGPGLIEAWRAVAAISLGGVYPIDYTRQTNGHETVVFRSAEGIVATGLCSITRMTCYVDIGGGRIHGKRGTFITAREVKALVDP